MSNTVFIGQAKTNITKHTLKRLTWTLSSKALPISKLLSLLIATTDWVKDFVGNGTLDLTDGQFVYDDDLGAFFCEQGTYD